MPTQKNITQKTQTTFQYKSKGEIKCNISLCACLLWILIPTNSGFVSAKITQIG